MKYPKKYLGIYLEKYLRRRCEDLTGWSFIQVGACDGIRGDPIHDMIIKYNWHGILIEPQPIIFKQLQDNYRSQENLKFENIAIHPNASSMDLYYCDKDCSLTSYNRNVRMLKTQIVHKISVPCMSLSDIVIKYKITNIDFLNIDTEGFDFQVITSLDFSLVRPRFIQFEFHLLPKKTRKKCINYLSSLGYVLKQMSRHDILGEMM